MSQPQQEGPELFGALDNFRAVDLSHPVSPHAPRWPGDPPVDFEPWSEIDRDGYYLRRLSMSEHGGTHLTAPASYYPEGRTVDQYTAGELSRPAVVIDVSDRCRQDRDYALTTEAVAVLGVAPREDTRRCSRPALYRLGPALERPCGLPRRRYGRHAAFSGLRPGCSDPFGQRTGRRGTWDRHGGRGTGHRQ